MRPVNAFIAALILLAFSPSSATADVQTHPAKRVHGSSLTFSLSGLESATVRSARLKLGDHSRKIPIRRARKGARRGSLRVSVPARWLGRSRRLREVNRKRARLIVVFDRAHTSARKKPQPTSDTTAPTIPQNVAAWAGDAQVSLSWSPSSDNVAVVDYSVWRRSGDGTWPSSPTATTSGTSATVSGLTNGTGYAFRITARDSAGNQSAPSATVTATPVAPTSEPPPPTTLPPPSDPVPPTSGPGASNEPIPTNARWVSPTGSDSAAGTETQPWRTLAKATASVGAGDTVVFRSGTYGAAGTKTYFAASGTSSAPITLRGYPNEPRPVILGMFRMSGSYQRVTGFTFDGPTGNVGNTSTPTGEDVQIWISGPNNEISHSEVRDSLWHAGIFLSNAENTRIVGNYIHDNGDFNDPGQVNQSHGIYWSSGSGLITNNVIEHNVAFGVHLYKGPHNVTVANNTITRHGRAGILFASNTRDSLAVNNIVTQNQIGIYTYSLAGTGNVAQNNLTWGNTESNVNTTGVSLLDNIVADPMYVSSSDYHLRTGSPAVDRGLVSLAPSIDYDGILRPQGNGPDLGAFEQH